MPREWLLRQTRHRTGRRHGRHAFGRGIAPLAFVGARTTGAAATLVLNALDLRHRVARDVMRPRQEIAAFNTEATHGRMSGDGGKDALLALSALRRRRSGQDLGVIHIKDLYALRDKARTAADLLPVARKLIYVPETARLEKLLQLFLERKLHFAVVVDEYGGTVGIVDTGKRDGGTRRPDSGRVRSGKIRAGALGENVWEAAGALPLHELEEIIGEMQHEESVTTASGWMTQKLGGFPKVGDALTFG